MGSSLKNSKSFRLSLLSVNGNIHTINGNIDRNTDIEFASKETNGKYSTKNRLKQLFFIIWWVS